MKESKRIKRANQENGKMGCCENMWMGRWQTVWTGLRQDLWSKGQTPAVKSNC